MEYGKGNVARLRKIEKSDVAQRGQCRRHQTGADVDYGDGGDCCIQRVENLHLIRSRRHINDFGNVRVKAHQRTARRFGIEGAGGYVVCVKIIKQGPRNGGLADPALIRAYYNHYWLRHIHTPQSSQSNGRSEHPSAWFGRDNGRNKGNLCIHSGCMR